MTDALKALAEPSDAYRWGWDKANGEEKEPVK